MRITEERLVEFQQAYEEDFGEAISLEEAREVLSRLAALYRVLLRPLPARPGQQYVVRMYDKEGGRDVKPPTDSSLSQSDREEF